MRRLTKESKSWRAHEKEYLKEENNVNLYLVTCLEGSHRYFILAKDKKQAIVKAKDWVNHGREFNPPYVIPYYLKDFTAVKVEDILIQMKDELHKGEGCGIETIF